MCRPGLWYNLWEGALRHLLRQYFNQLSIKNLLHTIRLIKSNGLSNANCLPAFAFATEITIRRYGNYMYQFRVATKGGMGNTGRVNLIHTRQLYVARLDYMWCDSDSPAIASRC